MEIVSERTAERQLDLLSALRSTVDDKGVRTLLTRTVICNLITYPIREFAAPELEIFGADAKKATVVVKRHGSTLKFAIRLPLSGVTIPLGDVKKPEETVNYLVGWASGS